VPCAGRVGALATGIVTGNSGGTASQPDGRFPACLDPRIDFMRFCCSVVLAVLLGTAAGGALSAQTPARPGAAIPAGPGRIVGIVTDPDGRPLETVAVTLRAASDSSLVTGVLTGRNGRFGIAGLPPGGYVLRVSLIGYRPRSSETIMLTADAPAVDLGNVRLEISAVPLAPVEAEAERAAIVVEADRTVYHTGSMPVAASGTATDVLRAVPELEVDVDSNVRLRGSQTVAVHLNGRPLPLRGEQLANFLQQLPGNRIARVEVMPNPSARHDPEGLGGIVNIVLKEQVELGLSGSASINASTRNRQQANGRFNIQRGRLTLFSGGGVNLFQNIITNYDLRQNLVTTPVTLIEQHAATDNRARGWNLDWTAEYKVGQRATLWSTAWMFSNETDADGLIEYGILDVERSVRERYDRVYDGGLSFGNYNLGFGFKQVFEPQREELTVDGRISRGSNDTRMSQTRIFHLLAGAPADAPPELTLNDVDAGNRNLSMQADYMRPLGPARLEIGYRAWLRDQDNDNVLRIFASEGEARPGEETRSGYEYREIFHSVYGTYARSIGRFGMQAGLRAELTGTRFDSRVAGSAFERDYNTLFPSLNVSYSPQRGQTVRIAYAKRISRPAPFYLDPFVPSLDPLNRFFGNPDLRPSYTQSVTLDYSRTGSHGTVRVAPYYRTTSDAWDRIRTVDTLGIATSRWENAQSSRAYGSSLTLSRRAGGRLSGSTSINVYREERDGSNIGSGYRRSAFLWSAGANLSARITPSLTTQLTGNHYPTQSILQGRASGYTFMTLALRQQVWGTRGAVSLNVSDPFKLFNYRSSSSDATYIQNSRSSSSMRFATLGFTYNFGRPPQQQSRRSAPDEAGETIRVP
jgi:hypothetical protein